ncbi:hypothetical protein GUI51_01970 [Enterococcus mundtii]|nr:hypothetical protein [Enterococcus mundtii]MZZ60618.1 hypothetical protein [Enterococcus mundtii]MZZ67603.1 hypothetical protein [Enterococcus mundtii]MZZ96454.1 hypothetical protein [Enterococcus mundtii]MZZ99428.1 hypothetical protein [Enterococcus mundtii]
MSSLNNDKLTITEFEKTLEIVFSKIPEEENELKFLVSSDIGFEILNLKLSINILLDRKHYTGILSLIRTMMENHIYLKYILEKNSNKRSRAYQLNVYRDVKKQYDAQKKNKKLQKMIAQDQWLKEQTDLYEQDEAKIKQYLKELDSLYGHKLVPWYNDDGSTKGIYKLFERMGKSDWYDGIYRYLCMEAHGNNGLKHFEMLDNGMTKLKPTILNEKQISSISCKILNETRKELANLIS